MRACVAPPLAWSHAVALRRRTSVSSPSLVLRVTAWSRSGCEPVATRRNLRCPRLSSSSILNGKVVYVDSHCVWQKPSGDTTSVLHSFFKKQMVRSRHNSFPSGGWTSVIPPTYRFSSRVFVTNIHHSCEEGALAYTTTPPRQFVFCESADVASITSVNCAHLHTHQVCKRAWWWLAQPNKIEFLLAQTSRQDISLSGSSLGAIARTQGR